MTIATKAELRDEVAAWLSRVGEADFLARFDSFLKLAESDFGSRLKSKVQERRLQATINERWETNPAGNNQIRSVAILNNGAYQDGGPLKYRTYQQIINKYGVGASDSTLVRDYTIVGEQIGFFPFPEEDLTSDLEFDMIAYLRPDPLLVDTDNNEVLTEYPGVYLYGTLAASAPYYGREEDLVRWRALYEAEINRANEEAEDTLGDALMAVAM